MPYVRADDVKEKHVGGELALYVGAHRAIHVLNPTARFIWESLSEPLTFDELLFVMGEAFDAAPDVLRDDLSEAIDQFVSLDMVTLKADGDAQPHS
jgi:hypothetical protein